MSQKTNTGRISFASSKKQYEYPDFLEVQLESFRKFFQLDTTSENRRGEGLYKVFQENFPITDQRNNFVLEFIDYFIDPPRYSQEECLEQGLTYSVPLKAKLKLYCTDPEHEDFDQKIQDIFLGTIPYMTESGTFIINGSERIVVSQLHRSPGVFFGSSKHANGQDLYSARIIPFKGSWIEFATDINKVMYAYIDRKKKLPVTTLLRAIGYETDKDILDLFDLAEDVNLKYAFSVKELNKISDILKKDAIDDNGINELIDLFSRERRDLSHKEDAATRFEAAFYDRLNAEEFNSLNELCHKDKLNETDKVEIFRLISIVKGHTASQEEIESFRMSLEPTVKNNSIDIQAIPYTEEEKATIRMSCVGRVLTAKVLNTWREDFADEDTGEVVSIERHEEILQRNITLSEENLETISRNDIESILLSKKYLVFVSQPNLKACIDMILSQDIVTSDGEVVLAAGTKISETNIQQILASGVRYIYVWEDDAYAIIKNTLEKDTCNNIVEAQRYIYRAIRSSEPPDDESAKETIEKMFFSDKRYDLGDVGRFRLNRKLDNIFEEKSITMPERDLRILTKADFHAIIEYLIKLINKKEDVDDIDHLSNRRIRTVGEQLANQFSIGLARLARTIRDRMSIRDNEVFAPQDLINSKTLTSVINSFFGTSQLSQFMDQANPLAEVTHKRRLSALGPGGLSRDRAGFEVRDVHYTHYGRLCPIETPEGPNIGLISSLCVFARINEMGFIETPYRPVKDGIVDLNDSNIKWLSAEDEEDKYVAQANIDIKDDGEISEDRIKCRMEADFPIVNKDEISLMDVAPNQVASVAASLIPFLEHDDANRALMGSNMMRQAVPLIHPEAPIVGTGLEGAIARTSRSQIIAEGKGEVMFVDANEIQIKYDKTEDEKFVSFKPEITTYKLPLYRKTNNNNSIHLRPIVRKGDRVVPGQIITEGYATQNGELALGRNLKVAFMPWKGYNYEDAIVLSERMLREDIFTSIHVEEFTTEVRDTKRGMEELTSDIPNVGEDATMNLDENGMIRIGAIVRPNDILIGKITPKGESDPSPEEKLLRAIFGDKAGDVKDASLKATPSLYGTIIDRKLYSRVMKDNSKKFKQASKTQIQESEDKYNSMIAELHGKFINKLLQLVKGKGSAEVSDLYGQILIPKGAAFTRDALESIAYENVNPTKWTVDKHINGLIKKLINNYLLAYKELDSESKREKYKLTIGDELPSGIMQLAKVYVAKKRKIRVGDKMAGRHGNKGIVAKVVRDEDMPFLADGTIVDIVLNPLGVPSRMNLGQIYETVLGWAGRELGRKYATPIFDGASLEEICQQTDEAGVPRYGKTQLWDGGTGEPFDQQATVGVIYMLKLGHMVDDKMHARSIGPYSLITQQPLGGKAQFGGQRFGEMEVWALEAFGASNILQEILTVKSDDVMGRSKAYEAIVKGENMPVPGIPESLNVLLHELRGLGVCVTLE